MKTKNMEYKDLIDTLMLLQNHDACTVVSMKDVSATRRFGFPTALIEVTEEQIENLRVQQSDVCFDVEQEIKFWFSGKFEVKLAYIADDDPDTDYKETVYGLHVIYKSKPLHEAIQSTVGEFANMKNIDAKEFSNFLKSTYDWARHAEVWTMVGFDTLEKCFADFKNRLSEECTSAEFQRMAPAKVISMTGMRSSKKALGKKDKYNRLGERARRG